MSRFQRFARRPPFSHPQLPQSPISGSREAEAGVDPAGGRLSTGGREDRAWEERKGGGPTMSPSAPGPRDATKQRPIAHSERTHTPGLSSFLRGFRRICTAFCAWIRWFAGRRETKTGSRAWRLGWSCCVGQTSCDGRVRNEKGERGATAIACGAALVRRGCR